MSVEGIRKIIRKHTGANANDNVKLTHAEIEAMIHSAEDHHKITMGERAELLSTLAMFGGSDIHPDIFPSPADKAAVAATAMKGIETSAKFEKLPHHEQYKFVWDCLVVGSGDKVGFTDTYTQLGDLPATVKTKVDQLLQHERARLGSQYEDTPYLNIRTFARGSDVYAYEVSASWSRTDGNGSWDADNYLGAPGELLKSTAGYNPPDPDPGS